MVKPTLFIFFAAIYYSHAFRVVEENGEETLEAQENEEVNIECKADGFTMDTDMTRCEFFHPSGKQFSIWSLEVGNCSYKANITAADSGQWRCQIDSTGPKVFNVRVTSQLPTMQQSIRTAHEKNVHLLRSTTGEGLQEVAASIPTWEKTVRPLSTWSIIVGFIVAFLSVLAIVGFLTKTQRRRNDSVQAQSALAHILIPTIIITPPTPMPPTPPCCEN